MSDKSDRIEVQDIDLYLKKEQEYEKLLQKQLEQQHELYQQKLYEQQLSQQLMPNKSIKPLPEYLEFNGNYATGLVPIRIDIEQDGVKIRDCFTLPLDCDISKLYHHSSKP